MTNKNFIRSRWYEDIPIGEFHVFGSHTFSELEVIEFGQKYAPESYHTDPIAARDSIYRGLIVPAWQIISMWMRMMVHYMERFAEGVQDGRRNGAGLGLQDLVWHKEVSPGHTLTFTYEIIEKPEKTIKKKWGIIRSRNEVFNQYNELVVSFKLDILAEKNPKNL